MSDEDKSNLTVIDFGDPEEREMELITEMLQDPWRRSTIELGIATGHIVADHGPSLAIILIAKHLGLMIRSYADPELLDSSLDTVLEEIRSEVIGDEDDPK